MSNLLFAVFIVAASAFFYLFTRGPYKFSPLWLMLAAWSASIGISRLALSPLEKPWTAEFWFLIMISLISFAAGFFIFARVFKKFPFWRRLAALQKSEVSIKKLRIVIYILFGVSLVALYMFYMRAGNFPLLAEDPDVFRFEADEKVPGLINYTAQFARIFIPLSFFVMFWQKFSLKKHWDLVLLSILGATVLTLYASRTQIFFVDLWVMALYLFIRKPNWRQALKFYPIFLIISVAVLAAVPLVRQYKSYGEGYLAGVTGIDSSSLPGGAKYLLPIYVGVAFNQQALLHAQMYYETHPSRIQMGRVTLDPFTNILGLEQFKSQFDLGDIFYSWWNTGTYLFPFVQDFGNAAFWFVPLIIAGVLTMLWRYWQDKPNYLSLNYYAYACFFIVMTVYLSFTVRAEMYIDIFLIFVTYLFVSQNRPILSKE